MFPGANAPGWPPAAADLWAFGPGSGRALPRRACGLSV